jgi:hypothetical protein
MDRVGYMGKKVRSGVGRQRQEPALGKVTETQPQKNTSNRAVRHGSSGGGLAYCVARPWV